MHELQRYETFTTFIPRLLSTLPTYPLKHCCCILTVFRQPGQGCIPAVIRRQAWDLRKRRTFPEVLFRILGRPLYLSPITVIQTRQPRMILSMVEPGQVSSDTHGVHLEAIRKTPRCRGGVTLLVLGLVAGARRVLLAFHLVHLLRTARTMWRWTQPPCRTAVVVPLRQRAGTSPNSQFGLQLSLRVTPILLVMIG